MFGILLLVAAMQAAPAMSAAAKTDAGASPHEASVANAGSSPAVGKQGSTLITWLPTIWIGAMLGIGGIGLAGVLIKLRRTIRQSRKTSIDARLRRKSSRQSSPSRKTGTSETAKRTKRTPKPAADAALPPIPFSTATVPPYAADPVSLDSGSGEADTRFYRYAGAAPYRHDDRSDPGEAGDAGNVHLRAEDVTDPLDLIEMWVTLDNPKAALDYIRNDLSVNDPNSPLIQLGMLEVFRSLAHPQRYAETARLLKTRYNIKVPDSPDSPEHDSIIGLHRLPHVKARLIDYWESDRVVPYIDTLISDNRNGTRTGLNIVAFKDIVRLSRLAKSSNRSLLARGAGENRAYQILFTMTQPGFRKAASAIPPKIIASKSGANSTLIPQIRERPRYITPSYERAIRQEAAAGTALPQARCLDRK